MWRSGLAVLAMLACVAVVCHGADPKDSTAKPPLQAAANFQPSSASVELHHSLHRPLDSSQVYWNFGGSTVMTKNYIRLTPAAQNRRGWLWNDYPVETENWEVEFLVDIHSKPHFGGDGFGFWMLDGSQDPTFQSDPTYLNGNVFGLREDFKGVGVVFDIYDNDSKRDNPSVFVLHNTGTQVQYNHDNDYADDMYKQLASGNGKDQYKCVAHVRNTANAVRVNVRMHHKVLSVFIDNQDGLEYKYCLSVQFETSFVNHHIAFTAHTGQVADAMDILELTTRYLDSSEKDKMKDDLLRASSSTCSTVSWLIHAVNVLVGAGLAILAAYEAYLFKTLQGDEINAVLACKNINSFVLPHYAVHATLSALMLLTFNFWPFLVNVPLLAYRAYLVQKKQFKISPVDFQGGEKMRRGLSFAARLNIALAVYVVTELVFLYQWATC